ncbi:MAG: EAL domain-containing protein, partial [Acidimicrobiales bacterium]
MLRDGLARGSGLRTGVADTGAEPDDVNWRELIEEVITGQRHHRIVAQPIVDLQQRQVAGYEALSRFDPPYPGCGTEQWFDAAHQVGLSGPFEALTLGAALELREQLPQNCFLSINLDPESMLTPEVRATLAHAGSLLGVYIEMTEHRRPDHFRLAGTLAWLRSRGAQIAVDDAGAGHSGLRQILEIRPELLKLDRSLVDGVDGNDSKVALIETMVLLAGRIDAFLLAEGVQTLAEAQRLTELGVGLAQGFVFARPGPPWPPIRTEIVGALSPSTVSHEPSLDPLLDRDPPLSFDSRASFRAT